MADVGSELALLRECFARALDREGIPMVLALVSEVGEIPPVQDDATLAEGARLARDMDRSRAALVPTSRDGDVGSVITVLQTVSYADFGRSAARL